MRDLLRSLVDLVLPARCAACASHVASGVTLCEPCAVSLVPGAGASCPRCALVYLTPPPGAATHLCGPCLTSPPPFSAGRAAFAYGAALADAISRWKNAPDHTLGPALGRLFVAELARAPFTPPPGAVVVPVPSTRPALRRRGFNPAGALATALARAYHLELAPTALVVQRPPAPSKGLDRAARVRRVRGVFAPRDRAVAGRPVILVDDVMTTGATARAAARALRRGRAREVVLAVLARAPRD